MSELHAIFRQVAGGGWQSYSRPASVYVAADTLPDIRREFGDAVTLLREDDPDLEVHEHVERAAAPGIYVRTALDDDSASRELTAAVMRSAVEVPGSMRLIQGRALMAATGDMVFVCCRPNDRIRWVSGQLGRVDALQVCAPAEEGGGIWWMPLASQANDLPADEAETLEAAGLAGEDAEVGQLPAAAQRFLEQAKQACEEVAAAFAAPLGTEMLPTFVATAA